jgi:two-component system CheB/CheR fusion protein
MRNLLHATEIATLYLDNRLRILRFTPAAARIINVRDQDVGRPVSDITAQFDTHLFAREAERVVETLQRREWEIQTKERKWFFMRMIPYRTTDNVISGVVITFIEVTEQKELEWRAQEARTLAGRVMESTRDALLVLDQGLRVRSANPSYYRTFGASDQETVGRPFFELAAGRWDIPGIRQLLEDIIPTDGEFSSFKAEGDFPGIGRKVMLLSGCRIDEREGLPALILLTIQDMTPGENAA